MLKEFGIYFLAAFFEILGCFSFWLVFKSHKSPLWLALGISCVVLFAYILTKTSLDFAGRSYVIYGGIYIISSLLWLYFIEGQSPNHWDISGVLCVFCGVFIMLWGSRRNIF
ncbi:YnfA family protein [Helicobacter muridarum]|nr:YnfA family protein [Helicobacter muridarum]TLD99942.1 YnfA family protein [Helicobacter muridarum]